MGCADGTALPEKKEAFVLRASRRSRLHSLNHEHSLRWELDTEMKEQPAQRAQALRHTATRRVIFLAR